MSAIDKAWACFKSDAITDASYKVSFVLDAVDALLMVIAYAVLARLFGAQQLDGFPALGFLLVGVAGNSALMTALSCFSQAVRGVQVAGTIKTVLTTPTAPATVMVLSSVYPLVRAGLDLVMWLIAAWLLGAQLAHLDWSSLLAITLVFLLSAAAMAGLGFASAAFAVVFKRGDPVIWLVNAVSMLMAGVLYPTSQLPSSIAWASQWLPATHALDAFRATLIDGAGVMQIGASLAALAAFALVGVPLGLMALGWSIRYARQEGTLGHV